MTTTYKTTRAYSSNDGQLEIISILRDDELWPCDPMGFPLHRTDEVRELRGWPDGRARVWLNDGGLEILVPEEEASWPRADEHLQIGIERLGAVRVAGGYAFAGGSATEYAMALLGSIIDHHHTTDPHPDTDAGAEELGEAIAYWRREHVQTDDDQ